MQAMLVRAQQYAMIAGTEPIDDEAEKFQVQRKKPDWLQTLGLECAPDLVVEPTLSRVRKYFWMMKGTPRSGVRYTYGV